MRNSYWIKSGFYTFLDKITQMVFNLGSFIIILRILDKATAGEWVLFATITAFIEVGRTGLLQNGMVTFLNISDRSEYPKISTASLLLNFGLSLLIVAALLLFSGSIGSLFPGAKQLPQLLQIYAATTFILSALYQFNFIQQANLDFKGLFWSSFVKNGILFFYVLYLFLSHSGIQLIELARCQIIAALPAALVAFFFARKYLDFSKTIDWGWVRKLFHYGKFTFGTNISTMAYKSVDKTVLGRLLLDSVSTYDLALRVNNLAEVPTTTLATILFPQSARRNHEEGPAAAKYLYEKSVGVLLGLILPLIVFILVFADLIVHVIGGAKYADSAPILRLTIFYGFFMAFAIQFGTVLDSIGKPKTNFLITTLGACVNLTCNYIFIKRFGLFGAPYGTLTAMTIMFIVMQRILYTRIGVRTGHTLRYMIAFYKNIFSRVRRFSFKESLAPNP